MIPNTLKFFTVIIALAAYLTYEFYIKVEYSPVVETSNGKVLGFISKSRLGKSFYSYLGIPYAQPAIGLLRFSSPKPAEKWSGVRNALKFGSACMQVDGLSRKITGNENCLFLNVYVPQKPFISGKLLPVIFYIHGGYFMVGSSTLMGPELLMDEELVLITVNYRLNAFGFLNTEDSSAKGNFGLKDQNLALKWVQTNIKNFGGDPARVTIAGQSAGSVGTHLHQLSPMSKGLFSAVIMSSGVAIKPWSLVQNPRTQANNLGTLLNCSTESSSELVSCLRKLDSKTIVNAYYNALVTPIMDELEIFAPSVENCATGDDDDCFLPAHPYEILKNGDATRVPMLTGVNSHEGNLATARIFLNRSLEEYVSQNWNQLSPKFFCYPISRTDLTDKIRKFYIGKDESKIIGFKENFQNITNVFTDRLYIHATRETVKIQSKFSLVYLYYFKYRADRGMSYVLDIDPNFPILLQFAWKEIMWFLNKYVIRQENVFLGVGHGDDIGLLFKFPVFDMSPRSKDFAMSQTMVKMWSDFAKDQMNMKLDNNHWEPVSDSDIKKLKYMLISDCDNHGSLVDEPFEARMKFWDDVNLPWM